MSATRVTLIPWDPESADHVTRMLDQRIECGWDSDMVPSWQAYQRSGFKCIYWIVSFVSCFVRCEMGGANATLGTTSVICIKCIRFDLRSRSS
ncbi:hypothetical protein LZ32DRAFT_601253 [Colletotrichum eremochloae]|nr:hypothetical protein LZ32DRAFT_601253 [Colletotrichum eremochloae]